MISLYIIYMVVDNLIRIHYDNNLNHNAVMTGGSLPVIVHQVGSSGLLFILSILNNCIFDSLLSKYTQG